MTWYCIGIICPFVLVLSIKWQKTNPLRHIKVVTLEERICSGVCSPPGQAFSHSLQLAELCAAGENTSFGILEIPIASAVVFLELSCQTLSPGHRAKQVNSACVQVVRRPFVGYSLHDTLMPLKCIASTQLVIASYPEWSGVEWSGVEWSGVE